MTSPKSLTQSNASLWDPVTERGYAWPQWRQWLQSNIEPHGANCKSSWDKSMLDALRKTLPWKLCSICVSCSSPTNGSHWAGSSWLQCQTPLHRGFLRWGHPHSYCSLNLSLTSTNSVNSSIACWSSSPLPLVSKLSEIMDHVCK